MKDPLQDCQEWLDRVASGETSMGQKLLKTLVGLPGGVEQARELAQRRGVHLCELTDDKGTQLVAASRHPFKIIC